MNIQRIKRTESRGITLIALVITIIVLLMLAGISVEMLKGENGILTKSKIAKDKTTEAESIERVKIEVLASYGKDGTIDKELLNENLRKINGLTHNDEPLSDSNKINDLPAIVTLNGNDIQIHSNGEVGIVPEMIAKIIENPAEYYGKQVTNYTEGGKTYRIFYVDKGNDFGDGANTIYLKADYSDRVQCSITYDTKQTKVKSMNPLWAKNRGSKESEWKNNEKAAAWLCDPSKWTKYCNVDKASYAIGAPSVEMYVKSYNQAYSEDTTVYTLGAKYSDKESPGYIYTLNGKQSDISKNDYSTGDNSLDYKKFNKMYCGMNKSGDWWLASPCALAEARVCFVYEPSAKLDFRNYNSGNLSAISPIICLKSSFIPEIKE